MVRSRTAPDVERKYKLDEIDENETILEQLQKDVIPDTALSSFSKRSLENRVITANFGRINTAMLNKVDKEDNKELSSNDFTNEDKASIHTHKNKEILDNITQDDINNWNKSGSTILSAVYPVGSIYMSVNNINPGELFGGNWEQIKDKFLLSAGDTYSAGSIGGEDKHTLTKSELPNTTLKIIDPTYSWTVNLAGYNTGSGTDYPGISGTRKNPDDNQKLRTESLGSGQAHNNMPPYLTVYVWKRMS